MVEMLNKGIYDRDKKTMKFNRIFRVLTVLTIVPLLIMGFTSAASADEGAILVAGQPTQPLVGMITLHDHRNCDGRVEGYIYVFDFGDGYRFTWNLKQTPVDQDSFSSIKMNWASSKGMTAILTGTPEYNRKEGWSILQFDNAASGKCINTLDADQFGVGYRYDFQTTTWGDIDYLNDDVSAIGVYVGKVNSSPPF